VRAKSCLGAATRGFDLKAEKAEALHDEIGVAAWANERGGAGDGGRVRNSSMKGLPTKFWGRSTGKKWVCAWRAMAGDAGCGSTAEASTRSEIRSFDDDPNAAEVDGRWGCIGHTNEGCAKTTKMRREGGRLTK
jgi:hypothetical protein